MGLKEQLLSTSRMPTRTHEVPGVGTILVRGLSRKELLGAEGPDDEHVLVRERRMLALAIVEPPMSEADIETWQSVSPASELNDVATVVNELSGVSPGSAKSGLPGNGDGPEPGV